VDEAAVRGYIIQTFPDVSVVEASGGTFFYTDLERKLPFATLVTSDEYDQFSDLGRPGVFRLNVGVSKQTFLTLFAAPPAPGGEGGYDYKALDRILPHPVYGKMYWVCVLNPSPGTFETVRGLLAEAHEAGLRQRPRRVAE
jgi:hypothetical protein